MSSSSGEPFDELTSFLQLPARQAVNPMFREGVLDQTLGVIRGRRRWKRMGLAAALVGCYLAGAITMSMWRSPTPSTRDVAGTSTSTTPSSDAAQDQQKSSSAAELRELELAFTTIISPYERLRRAGDRLLADETDIPGAIRTYQRALQVAAADERTVSVDHDSWLLMALKSDQSNSSFVEKMP